MIRNTKSLLLVAAAVAAASFGQTAGCGSYPELVRSDTTGSGGAPHASSSAADGFGGDVLAGGSSQPLSLAFDPPKATLVIDAGKKKSEAFTLVANYPTGPVPVSAEALEFDRPDLGVLTPGDVVKVTADGSYAGTGKLHGIYQGIEAVAEVTVVVKKTEVGAGVDPGAVAALGAPSLPDDPLVQRLSYPYDRTVFPLGLASPLLMWSAPNPKDTYLVRYEEAGYAYEGYFEVSAPAKLRVPQPVWDRLTASNTGDVVKVTLSRYDAVQKVAYASAHEQWTIAPSSLRGAIYYWTTSGGGHLARIQPGIGAHPAVMNDGKCMGCHAVSADGTTLVATVEDAPAFANGQKDRAWVAFDLPSGQVRSQSAYYGGTLAVNPDGKYVVFGSQKLHLGTTADGQLLPGSGLESVPLDPGSTGMMMPAFSPDGKHLAAISGTGTNYLNLTGGRLVLIDFDEKNAAFSNLTKLASAAGFPASERALAYPTIAPDAQWIAFGVGNYPTGCDAQGCTDTTQQTGSIWLQRSSGASPVRLTNLTDSSDNPVDHDVSFEPTFNPVARGGYHWLVFTSMRDWGNELVGTPNNGKKRLWVAAIDPAVKDGEDPSHPAFFLEGQEEATVNMRGFWSLAPCNATGGPKGCSAGFECCSGFCADGQCVDPNTFACQGAGDSCKTSADCCNAPYVTCTSGACSPVVPH